MNKLSGAKQMKPIDPMGRAQGILGPADNPGGYMESMSAQKVGVPAGGNAKSAMIDGPFGGKVKA